MTWTETYFRIQTIGMWVDWALAILYVLAVVCIVVCSCWPWRGKKK